MWRAMFPRPSAPATADGTVWCLRLTIVVLHDGLADLRRCAFPIRCGAASVQFVLNTAVGELPLVVAPFNSSGSCSVHKEKCDGCRQISHRQPGRPEPLLS